MRSGVECCVEYMEQSCDECMEQSCDQITCLNSRTLFEFNYKLYIQVTLIPSLIINLFFKSITTSVINRFSNLGLLLFSVIFAFMPQIINSKPLVKPLIGPSLSSDTFSYAMDFLVKYGYLPRQDMNSINLRSEQQLKEAISTMQRFANLPPTGAIDNATLALMRRRRCGVPDLFQAHHRVKRYALQGSKWHKTDLTWSIRNWSPHIDSQYVLKELKKAFKVWSDVSKLTFTETRDPDADIVISFLSGWHGDEYPFDGPGSILGHAFFPGQGIGGDAHFDADEQWSKKRHNQIPDDNYDKNEWEGVSLFAVAAHEFGHSLGLSHSSVQGSLMFPYYQSIGDDFKLPDDDVVGIQQLYGSKTSTKWAPMLPLPPPDIPKHPLTKRPQIGPRTRPSPTLRPPSPSIPESSPDIPNACNTNFDAIASIRKDIFIFKGKYFWWLKYNRTFNEGRYEPVEIYRYWTDLPKDIEKVDAVFERQSDKKIVFFIGKEYWVFNNNRAERGYPRPLTHLGLPQHLERIDAAMVWGHNGKVYLFSGSVYWRFEEEDNKVELDYPRDMSVWKGIPYNIDAAFQWSIDSHTYFFKGHYFWRFDNRRMKVSEDYPQSISSFWFESLLCKKEKEIYPKISENTPSIHSINSSGFLKLNFQINMIVMSTLLFYNFCIFNLFI